MRILIAVHGYPPVHSAGAERLAERIAHWLAASGHEIEVLAIEEMFDDHYRIETSKQDGITVHRVFYNVGEGFHTPQYLYHHPQIETAFQSVLSSKRFDLVHLVSGYLLAGPGILAPHAMNIPVVITLTEYWFMCGRLNLIHEDGSLCTGPTTPQKCARCLLEAKRRFQVPARLAPGLNETYWDLADRFQFHSTYVRQIGERQAKLKELLEAADRVICPSQYIVNQFGSQGYDTSRFVVVRHGLAISERELPTESDRSDEQLRLGYLGQIKHHKGADLLIDALLPLLDVGKHISLDLWGPEEEAQEYVGELRRRTENYPTIRWNGRYNGSRVWEILKSFDVLVVPSRWYENSPIVVKEAFHMKRPVIATNLGGMAEMIEHGTTGLVFELNDSADLRRQIEHLLDEPGLLEKLRTNIPVVRTVNEEMKEVVDIYQQLLETVTCEPD